MLNRAVAAYRVALELTASTRVSKIPATVAQHRCGIKRASSTSDPPNVDVFWNNGALDSQNDGWVIDSLVAIALGNPPHFFNALVPQFFNQFFVRVDTGVAAAYHTLRHVENRMLHDLNREAVS